ncbi:hypothetical protein ACET3Z_018151 [Daucus carota]
MLETFGPTYERPDFKNVLPKRKARRTAEASSEPFESNYFRDYEDYEQQQTPFDFAASGPFDSEPFDVGPSAPQYDVGVSQSQFEQPFGEESYRAMLYVDPTVQVDQPISREDPNVPFLDLPPEGMLSMQTQYVKGHPLKPLNQTKVDWLKTHWWSGGL